MSITLHTHKIVLGLTTTAALLVAANLAGLVAKFHYGDPFLHKLVPLFDLDGERNIPSLFSTGLILLCAGLMGATALARWGENRTGWLGLSLIFTFLAADELVSLHERLIDPLRAALHTSGLLYFAWLIPYGLAVVLIGALYLRFLLRLPGATRRRMIAAGVVYLAGAVGLELIGGAYLESLGDQHNLPYELLTTLEESLEMTGMILLARGLLRHIVSHLGGVCSLPNDSTLVVRMTPASPAASTRCPNPPPWRSLPPAGSNWGWRGEGRSG